MYANTNHFIFNSLLVVTNFTKSIIVAPKQKIHFKKSSSEKHVKVTRARTSYIKRGRQRCDLRPNMRTVFAVFDWILIPTWPKYDVTCLVVTYNYTNGDMDFVLGVYLNNYLFCKYFKLD